MNPLTNVKNITKLNEQELKLGINENCSWHKIYKHSPWIFIGGLDYDLTEGDIICVFSQYGEVEDINLVRDKKSGKSKGFCFLSYQNTVCTTLAVDNFNGIKLCGRTIRVDHVADYRPPKENKEESDNDSITDVKSLRQGAIKEGKPRHKDKQHKTDTGDNAKEVSKQKCFHTSSKSVVPKQVAVNKIKRHHNQARDLFEKSFQGSSNRQLHKDDVHSYKDSKTEERSHSSSEESIKHKMKKEKYKDSKSYRKYNHCLSSFDESDKPVHPYNQPRTEEKASSSSDESIKTKHKPKKEKYRDSKSFSRKRNRSPPSSDESDTDDVRSHKQRTEKKFHSNPDESIKTKHKPKKEKYRDSKFFSRKRNHSPSSSDESGKDDVRSHKQRTEKTFHSSSDESSKIKQRKYKHKDDKSSHVTGSHHHLSSDESDKRAKHKSKHKHKHKYKDSRPKNSD